MRFLTYGDRSKRSLLLIHGMANTSDLFYPILPYLKDYYCIVCELDGHSKEERGEFVSISDSCGKIEEYVDKEFGGDIYGLLGFSLGGTIATELISRGKIRVGRTILDAAFVISFGLLGAFYRLLFQGGIWALKKNIPLPACLVESIMGKGNFGVVDTLFKGVSLSSIGKACRSCFTYEIDPAVSEYKNPIVFWYGENEPYPQISAKLLRKHLPRLRKRVYKGMGHGQMLREHPEAYAIHMKNFLDRPDLSREQVSVLEDEKEQR